MPRPDIGNIADGIRRKHSVPAGDNNSAVVSRALVNAQNTVVLDVGGCETPAEVLAALGLVPDAINRATKTNAEIPAITADNALAFGATGDGVTDDTVALQAWLDSTVSKRKLLPAGTYKITSTLFLNQSNLMVCGEGAGAAGTKIHMDGAGDAIQCADGLSTFNISDFWIEGPGAETSTGVGLLFDSTPSGTQITSGVSLHRLSITGFQTGAKLCEAPNLLMVGVLSGANKIGFHLKGVDSALILNCHAVGYGTIGGTTVSATGVTCWKIDQSDAGGIQPNSSSFYIRIIGGDNGNAMKFADINGGNVIFESCNIESIGSDGASAVYTESDHYGFRISGATRVVLRDIRFAPTRTGGNSDMVRIIRDNVYDSKASIEGGWELAATWRDLVTVGSAPLDGTFQIRARQRITIYAAATEGGATVSSYGVFPMEQETFRNLWGINKPNTSANNLLYRGELWHKNVLPSEEGTYNDDWVRFGKRATGEGYRSSIINENHRRVLFTTTTGGYVNDSGGTEAGFDLVTIKGKTMLNAGASLEIYVGGVYSATLTRIRLALDTDVFYDSGVIASASGAINISAMIQRHANTVWNVCTTGGIGTALINQYTSATIVAGWDTDKMLKLYLTGVGVNKIIAGNVRVQWVKSNALD